MLGSNRFHLVMTCLLVIMLSGCESYEQRLVRHLQNERQYYGEKQDKQLDSNAASVAKAARDEAQRVVK